MQAGAIPLSALQVISNKLKQEPMTKQEPNLKKILPDNTLSEWRPVDCVLKQA